MCCCALAACWPSSWVLSSVTLGADCRSLPPPPSGSCRGLLAACWVRSICVFAAPGGTVAPSPRTCTRQSGPPPQRRGSLARGLSPQRRGSQGAKLYSCLCGGSVPGGGPPRSPRWPPPMCSPFSVWCPASAASPAPVGSPDSVVRPALLRCPVSVVSPALVRCPASAASPASVRCPASAASPASVRCPVLQRALLRVVTHRHPTVDEPWWPFSWALPFVRGRCIS